MFGLTLAFAEKTISGLIFSALIVGVMSFFGQASIFDPIILIAFIAIALAFRRNIDLLSICAIFIAERGLEELMWRFLDYTIWFKIPCYLIFFILAYWHSKGTLRQFVVTFYSIAIAIETYWYLTSYTAPAVMWLFYFLTVNIIIRRLLRDRTFILIEINPKFDPRPLSLDSQLLLANIGFIVINASNIIEYWIRHLTNYSDIVILYNIFPYVSHLLSLFMLYMIVIQSIYHLKELELNA